MITTGIDKRVKVQQIIENQIPEFLLSESPKAVDFLKQYYISQEYQGGPIDLTDNLDQYIKLDNLTPEVVVGETTLTSGIATVATTVNVLVVNPVYVITSSLILNRPYFLGKPLVLLTFTVVATVVIPLVSVVSPTITSGDKLSNFMY